MDAVLRHQQTRHVRGSLNQRSANYRWRCLHQRGAMLFCIKLLVLLSIIQLMIIAHSNYRDVYANLSIRKTPNTSFLTNKTNQQNRKYSSFDCIGYDGNIPRPNTAVCRFDNVCYSINNTNRTNKWPKGKFFYFENENQSRPPDYIFNDHGKILFNFDQLHIDFKAKYEFKVNIINSSIPNSSNVYWFKDKNIVIHAPFYPANFGHCLGDDFLATYKVLSKFGLYSAQKCQVIFLNYFDVLYDPIRDPLRIARSNKFYQMINPYLYDNNYIFLTQFEDNITATNSNIKYICFEKMVIASQQWSRQNYDTFEWSDFLDIFLNKYESHKQQMNELYARKKQKILFLSKSEGWHGRTWANKNISTEIIDYLCNLFKVSIDSAYDYELAHLSLHEQIDLALQYTVLIAPSGAVSYFGAFMAPHTAVVVKDVFDIIHHKSLHLDYWIWNYDYRKKIFYISTNESDAHFLLSKEKMIAKGATQLALAYRDAASFYLHPKKVAYVVYNALNWVEKKLNWENSFYVPHDWQNYMTLNT